MFNNNTDRDWEIFGATDPYNVRDFHVYYTNHGGHLGVVVYFMKPNLV